MYDPIGKRSNDRSMTEINPCNCRTCPTQVKEILGFGYFPRHKYRDLVFYVKYVGDPWNHSLIEIEDNKENRELLELLSNARPLKEGE
jgi:hypothetical protein